MQRFTVRPLLIAVRWFLSTGGNFLNQSGMAALAGTGSAITPWSFGEHRNSIRGLVI